MTRMPRSIRRLKSREISGVGSGRRARTRLGGRFTKKSGDVLRQRSSTARQSSTRRVGVSTKATKDTTRKRMVCRDRTALALVKVPPQLSLLLIDGLTQLGPALVN